MADVNAEGGEETVGLITAAGGTAAFVRTDVAVSADVQAMVARTVERFGRLDFAHNNAGVPSANLPVADFPEEEWIASPGSCSAACSCA